MSIERQTAAMLEAARIDTVTDSLSVLISLPNAPQFSAALVQAWRCAFDDAGIRTEEIMPAVQRAFGKSEFFPAPVKVIECAKAIRAEKFRARIDTTSAIGAGEPVPATEAEMEAFHAEVLGCMTNPEAKKAFAEVFANNRKRRAVERPKPRGRFKATPIDVNITINEDDIRKRNEAVAQLRRELGS